MGKAGRRVETGVNHEEYQEGLISRRGFLKLILYAALSIAVPSVTGALIYEANNGKVTGKEAPFDSEYLKDSINWLNAYGLDLYIGNRALDKFAQNFYDDVSKSSEITKKTFGKLLPVVLAEPPTQTDLEAALSYLIEDPEGITKFPPEFFINNRIHGARFVQGLTLEDDVYSCCYVESTQTLERVYKNGFVDSVENVASICVKYKVTDDLRSAKSIIATFDHECLHLLDRNDEFGGDMNIIRSDDEAWARLNGPDDPYTHNHETTESNETTNDVSIDERFVSQYGMTSVHEDKARYASTILQAEEFNRFQARTNELAQSVNQIDRQVADVRNRKVRAMQLFYQERSGGKMDDAYWKDLAAGKISPSRFLTREQLANRPIKANYV